MARAAVPTECYFSITSRRVWVIASLVVTIGCGDGGSDSGFPGLDGGADHGTVDINGGGGIDIEARSDGSPDVADAATNAPPATRRGKQELILIVDDEAAIRHALNLALESSNYRVLLAANGREAVSLFLANRQSVRLVLTDIMMPGMNGAALIRTLRALEPRLHVVALSGLHDKDRREELAALGVTRTLAKPCSADEILEAVQRELTQAVSSDRI